MSKESYIRFRCTEQEKAFIEAMAMQEGVGMSEFLLGLANDQKKFYREIEVFIVVFRNGNEIGRKSIGMYLTDEYGRVSVEKTWKNIYEKGKEYYSEFNERPAQYWKVEVKGKIIATPHPFSSFVILDKELFEKANND